MNSDILNPAIYLEHVFKSYEALTVLQDFSMNFTMETAPDTSSGIYCLMAPSGAGKTTLFRLIMGLEKPDSGIISLSDHSLRFSAVFQENRLIEHLSPMENIMPVMPYKTDKAVIYTELMALLPEESLTRPVSTLSGGMKRRCSVLRAILAPSDVVIMDEPFTGLDYDTKNLVIRYLLEHQNHRLFLIATHDPEDVKKLGAVTVDL
ncbi:MAG: ATP-binding cassette domain-containing protein [Clostridium sp.]